jgi:RNA polymerase sigma factor (sigma-70 family)
MALMDLDPDLALLERWRGGDRQAGQDLFGRHFAGIYRFFEHKAGSEADELAQRTFLACVAARDQFRAQSSFRTYLFVIARHELYSYLRGRKQGERLDFGVTSIADVVTSPSSRLGRAQQIGQLHEALAELPADDQLLLELHYWHDLDAAALGEVFDAKAGAIRVRLLRARRGLRAVMARIEAAPLADAPLDRMMASLSKPEVAGQAPQSGEP